MQLSSFHGQFETSEAAVWTGKGKKNGEAVKGSI